MTTRERKVKSGPGVRGITRKVRNREPPCSVGATRLQVAIRRATLSILTERMVHGTGRALRAPIPLEVAIVDGTRHPLFDALALPFVLLPPVVFVLVLGALLASGWWLARHTWRSAVVLYATTGASEVATTSAARGLVRVRGRAEGADPSSTRVYSERSRSVETGGRRRRTSATTTGRMRVVDDAGACWVDIDRATMVTTTRENTHEPFDNSDWSSEGAIVAGDAVFALGRLYRAAPNAQCELRPAAGGVLLVSGGSVRQVQVMYALYLLFQMPALLALAGLIGWGAASHVASYPPGGAAGARTFARALVATPFTPAAGATHADWPPAIRGEAPTSPL
jgi:hypothetical protein